MWTTIILVVITIWMIKRYFIRFIIPRWVWPALGFSAVFIILLNGKEMLAIAVSEAKAWFPLLKTALQNTMEGMRDLIRYIANLGK